MVFKPVSCFAEELGQRKRGVAGDISTLMMVKHQSKCKLVWVLSHIVSFESGRS
jgi:hypothetical protein